MTKNIEWLKEEIGELPCVNTVFNSDGSSYMDSAVPVMSVYDLINQLDEPEKPVELQELIEKYSKDSMSTYDVKVEREKFVNDLQNLLVPKQGELESKIQKLIEKYEQEDGEHSNPENAWIDDFIYDLEHLLEEEKRYVVVDSKGSYILAKVKGEIMTMGEILEFYGHESVDIDYNLTEQEIKVYDPRYMSFAKLAEELEE